MRGRIAAMAVGAHVAKGRAGAQAEQQQQAQAQQAQAQQTQAQQTQQAQQQEIERLKAAQAKPSQPPKKTKLPIKKFVNTSSKDVNEHLKKLKTISHSQGFHACIRR